MNSYQKARKLHAAYVAANFNPNFTTAQKIAKKLVHFDDLTADQAFEFYNTATTEKSNTIITAKRQELLNMAKKLVTGGVYPMESYTNKENSIISNIAVDLIKKGYKNND